MRVAYAIFQQHTLAVFTSPSVRDAMCGKNLDFIAIDGQSAKQFFGGTAPSRLCAFDRRYMSLAGCWFLPLAGRT